MRKNENVRSAVLDVAEYGRDVIFPPLLAVTRMLVRILTQFVE